jgi:hypothetical protein
MEDFYFRIAKEKEFLVKIKVWSHTNWMYSARSATPGKQKIISVDGYILDHQNFM